MISPHCFRKFPTAPITKFDTNRPSAPGFAREASDPYRAPRILQWIGSHPKQTLVAICPTIATAAADRYFLYQPSYRGLIDAPVKQLLSPVTGTVLVAGGETSMSVAKGQPLFTIKNANDGREQVRDAKEQTVALEEEIKYLETVRASLLQRQITQGITNPSDWISKPALPLTEKWATQNTDLPDRPDFNAAPPEDYFAPRIAEINAKLAAATTALETSKATLAAAEEAFRQNEKAEVTSPAAVSLSDIKPGYVIADVWIAEKDWAGEIGFASQIGRKAKVTLK